MRAASNSPGESLQICEVCVDPHTNGSEDPGGTTCLSSAEAEQTTTPESRERKAEIGSVLIWRA